MYTTNLFLVEIIVDRIALEIVSDDEHCFLNEEEEEDNDERNVGALEINSLQGCIEDGPRMDRGWIEDGTEAGSKLAFE